MKEAICKNLKYLNTLTKDEADFIKHILDWDQEQRVAFCLAKQIFETELDDDEFEEGLDKLRGINE